MLAPFQPLPRDRRADAFLGEVPLEHFSDRLYEAGELVERYVSDLALDLASRLRLDERLDHEGTLAEIRARAGFSAEEDPALGWLLRRLVESGHLSSQDSEAGERFALPRPFRPAELAELRAIGLAIDPAIARTLAILDAAAEALPSVLAGAATGEQALFSGARMQLWVDYFHNANPIYALNNKLAAIALANRLRRGSGLRILEVGAGAGSAAEALLDELARRGRLGDILQYRLTEPNPLLRRRAMRSLAARFPGLALADQSFDVDIAPEAQGLGRESFDAVLAVNVLHIARDLRAALGTVRTLLEPGGWLVAGECMRLLPGQTIAVELVFQQLRSFTRVELDPEVRPSHGFLSPEAWRGALEATGFSEIGVVPDLESIRQYYPRFFAGAICGCSFD